VRPLVVILGPTASGKSQLALRLAREFNGEIVGADSRQVYRGLDIGTAKPTAAERELIPHYLIDIVNPGEDFSLALYQQLAYAAIDDIHRRGRLPLLTGGSGQYLWAVLEGWQIPAAAPDEDYRRQLEESARRDPAALYDELRRVDPEAAEHIDGRNLRRVIRALEVCRQTGGTFSGQRGKQPPPYRTLIIGLQAPREEIYRRVDARVEAMIEGGMVNEVRGLREIYGGSSPALDSIGYRQIGQYLSGEMSLAEAAERMKTETHRLVRRQFNWFRLKDERICWFNIAEAPEAAIISRISEFLQGEGETTG